MKLLFLIVTAALAGTPAKAINYSATRESVWERYASGATFRDSDAALRLVIEYRVLGRSLPPVASATPIWVELKRWERLFASFGVPALADDYANFLRKVKADLLKTNNQ